jgi:hypothetical protein
MQRAINMHTSQISHGVVEPGDLDLLNEIVTGYTPSMIKIVALGAGFVPQEVYLWYSTLPELIFTPNSMEDTIVIPTERGFVLSGTNLVALEADATGFIWETYGCDNDGDYRDDMNDDAVEAGDLMDPIDPYLPDINFADPDDQDDDDDDDGDTGD